MEGDSYTDNLIYNARERYPFGASDYVGIFGVEGAEAKLNIFVAEHSSATFNK